MNENAAKRGNLCDRLSTLLSLALAVALFFIEGKGSTTRMVLFLLWIAYSVYASVKVISDLVGGQGRREKNFTALLDRWTQQMGSRAKALRIFTVITAVTAVIRLGVPLLIRLL